MKKDDLFEIFKKKLSAADPSKHDTEMLIMDTVNEYLEKILSKGHIPTHFVEAIEKDLQDEVLEMFRKKTYGFQDLKDYKQAQKNKSRSRAT